MKPFGKYKKEYADMSEEERKTLRHQISLFLAIVLIPVFIGLIALAKAF